MSCTFGPYLIGQQGVQPSKEDEDLNRAIQDSLMTASFHSASALKADQPSHKDREEGA